MADEYTNELGIFSNDVFMDDIIYNILSEVRALDVNYPIPDELAQDYLHVQRTMKLGNFAEARDALLALLERFPENPYLLSSLGTVYLNLGKNDKTEDYNLRALEKAPRFSFALDNLCTLYCQQGRLEEAKLYAEKTIQANPKSAESWTSFGIYYLFKGEPQKALEYFLASYSYDNKFPIAAYNAGYTYVKLGRIEEALPYLIIALDDVRTFKLITAGDDFTQVMEIPEFKKRYERAAAEWADKGEL